MTRFVMVWGTSSGAGKSWLATALCRSAARRGTAVKPFKAQNMSNNARVVAGLDGLGAEIGAAQYFQALAAGVEPGVDMNPVLLKPERDTASQVVVHGRVDAALGRIGWRERSPTLAAAARASLQRLAGTCDLVVIEGAGSPAEINLARQDYVNLGAARQARELGTLHSLLVADIDRGGAFAHLFGTHQLLPAAERACIRGFVLNRFRGDPTLLAPGPQQLLQLTGVPTVAVLPMWREHGLPEEDGVFDEATSGSATGPVIAVVAYPHISNLDEFQPLRTAGSVRLRWARTPAALEGADWVVLPGSKHTSGDLAWLRAQGLDAAIARHAAAGRRVLGICGGLQMLGTELRDPHGVDGAATGLGLLPLTTQFERRKLLRHTRARFDALEGDWAALSQASFGGYEIRHGRTEAMAGTRVALRNAAGEPIGWQRGPVLGLYAHGLFESPAAMQALFGATVRTLDSVFDGLADFIDHHFDADVLHRLLQP